MILLLYTQQNIYCESVTLWNLYYFVLLFFTLRYLLIFWLTIKIVSAMQLSMYNDRSLTLNELEKEKMSLHYLW